MQSSADIIESKNIRSILTKCRYNSWIILDLDNTVFEPCDDQHSLGSEQWFTAMLAYAYQVKLDTIEAVNLVLTVYQAIHHHIRMQAVQPEIIAIIAHLQEMEVPVIALTARGPGMKQQTQAQLKALGIQFDAIIYCDGGAKSSCLKAFFDDLGIMPENIVMADNKLKNLQEVQAAFTKFQVTFSGLRYAFLDEKVANFVFGKALMYLYKITPWLSQAAIDAMFKLELLPKHSLFAYLETCTLSEDNIAFINRMKKK